MGKLLLVCPFCKGVAKVKDMKKLTYYVECSRCRASTGMHMQKPDAIDAWNIRDGVLRK